MPYWKIEPSSDRDSDFTVLPGNSEADHRTALEYAQDRLEAAWDRAEIGSGPCPITIEYCEGDIKKYL